MICCRTCASDGGWPFWASACGAYAIPAMMISNRAALFFMNGTLSFRWIRRWPAWMTASSHNHFLSAGSMTDAFRQICTKCHGQGPNVKSPSGEEPWKKLRGGFTQGIQLDPSVQLPYIYRQIQVSLP